MAEQKVSRLWAYFLALSESSALSAIRAAVITLLLYGLFAAVFFTNVEGWTTVEAIYFSMVTMSAVGYGDLAPTIWYSRLVGVAFILVGIILVFVQVGGVMGLFAKPLFDRTRVLADDLWAPQYVPFTDETGSHKIEAPRRPLIFYTKGLVGPITILLLFQFFSAAIFIWVEPDWDLQTAIWYVMVTATTVGYGDVSVSKSNAWAMAWASLHILLSVSLLAALIEDITELRKKRKDMLTQVFQFKKCHEKATLTDLDADDTGSVDEAEFVLGILVKIGKVDEVNDVEPIRKMFKGIEGIDHDMDGRINVRKLDTEPYEGRMKEQLRKLDNYVRQELHLMEMDEADKERKNKERHDKEAKARQDKDTATPHLAPSGARVVPEHTVDPRPPLPAPADPPLPAFVTPLPARPASPVALVLQPPPPAHPPPEVARCTTVYVTW